MTNPSPSESSHMTPLFRWDGAYWGFLLENQLYDRYGRHVGWFETPGIDVYDLSGHFMGELWEEQYVLRSIFRSEPIPRASRAPVPYPTPPAAPPERDARDPREDWSDALPWPLAPPEPPTR
jgi:hypothetical protein